MVAFLPVPNSDEEDFRKLVGTWARTVKSMLQHEAIFGRRDLSFWPGLDAALDAATLRYKPAVHKAVRAIGHAATAERILAEIENLQLVRGRADLQTVQSNLSRLTASRHLEKVTPKEGALDRWKIGPNTEPLSDDDGESDDPPPPSRLRRPTSKPTEA